MLERNWCEEGWDLSKDPRVLRFLKGRATYSKSQSRLKKITNCLKEAKSKECLRGLRMGQRCLSIKAQAGVWRLL